MCGWLVSINPLHVYLFSIYYEYKGTTVEIIWAGFSDKLAPYSGHKWELQATVVVKNGKNTKKNF